LSSLTAARAAVAGGGAMPVEPTIVADGPTYLRQTRAKPRF
jgi:hypothetical protein